MYIYIIRHGETFGNLSGDGTSETDLTPKGIKQAELTGERFRNTEITKFYVSPLIRAVKTCREISVFHPGVPVIVTSDLFEQGTKACYEGIGEERIREIIPEAKAEGLYPMPSENAADTYKRACDFIERVKKENSFDSHIVIVAHGSYNSFLVSAALGMPLKEHFNFSHVNTGVTLVQYLPEDDGKNIRTKLKYLNDTSHLYNPHRSIL